MRQSWPKVKGVVSPDIVLPAFPTIEAWSAAPGKLKSSAGICLKLVCLHLELLEAVRNLFIGGSKVGDTLSKLSPFAALKI